MQLPAPAAEQGAQQTQASSTVPNESLAAKAVAAVSFQCPGCGKEYGVNDTLAGKRVRCKCGAVAQVPAAAAETPDSSLGDLLEEELKEPIAPAPLPVGPPVALPRRDWKQAESQRRLGRSEGGKKKSESGLDTLTIVTAALCCIHGLARSGSLYFNSRLILSGHVFSFSGILVVCSVLVTVGIAAAGIGLFTKQTWATPIGFAAGVGYFAVMGISLIMGLIAIARLGLDFGSGLGPRFGFNMFAHMIPRVVAESITPGLLIHLYQRERG